MSKTGSLSGRKSNVGSLFLIVLLLLPVISLAQTSVTRVQSVLGTASGSANNAVFPSTPTEGNLLVAITAFRDGPDAATNPVSPGSGWILRSVNVFTASTNEFERRGIAVWTKIAGSSEPTSITTSWSPTRDDAVIIQEFSVTNGTFEAFLGSISANTGVTYEDDIFSGNIPNSVSSNYLVIGSLVTHGSSTSISWTGGLGNTVLATRSNPYTFGTGYGLVNTATNISTTATPDGFKQQNVALLAIKLGVAGTNTYNSNSTFTVPAGVTQITVDAWGGGGGGAASTGNTSGGGGGGGGFARATFSVTPGQDYTITIGGGGTAGNPGGLTQVSGNGYDIRATGGGSSTTEVAGTGGSGSFISGTFISTQSRVGGSGGAGLDGGGPPNNRGGGGGGGSPTFSANGGPGGNGTTAAGGAGGTGQATGGTGGRGSVNATAGGAPGAGGGGKGVSSNSGTGGTGRVIVTFVSSTSVDASESEILASPTSILADGVSTSQITVNARNADGNLLLTGGATVVLNTTGGSLGSVTDNGNGTYSATLTSGVTDGTALITGTINGNPIGNTTSVTIGLPTILYSYQSGNWGTASNWTLDPSGTTLTGSKVPEASDQVVILNGRTITRSSNNITVASLTIQAGAVLDLTTSTGHNFGIVAGQGLLRLNSMTFPSGSFAPFNSVTGGTVEYYNVTGTLPTGQSTYNNLRILNSTASNYTITLNSDLTLNGNFTISRTGSGTMTFQQGASTTPRIFTINGSVTVGTGTSWTVNNANVFHQTSVGQNFTNNGTVRFTNLASPQYTSAATNGAIILTMTGSQNNTMALAGTTDLYRLVLDKGIDQTHILTVTSTNVSNFRLLGQNNQGNNPSQNPANPNPEIFKALTLNHGTLRLTENIEIESLTEGGDDIWVRRSAALWIDGANVVTTVPANGTSYQAITITGRLIITAGSLSTNNSAGIIYTADGVVDVRGGTIVACQMRNTGGGQTAYIQSGGTVILDGVGENQGGTPRFDLQNAEASFVMTGGTLDVRAPNNIENGGININVNTVNASVFGGTVRVVNTTGSHNFQIQTTAPFYNMVLDRTGGTGLVQINNQLRIQNNLTINNPQTLIQNGFNVLVGGNFDLNTGGTLNPGTSTLTFNGSALQQFKIDGSITTGLSTFTINKPADTLRLTGSVSSLNVINGFNLLSGVFDDNGKTVDIRSNMVVNGSHIGTGKLLLTTATSRTIGGNGNGQIGNIDISGPASAVTVTQEAPLRINGTLAFIANGANNRIYDIGGNNLTLGPNATVTGVNGPSAPIRMIKTNGLQSAGGLTKIYNDLSFTFPVGAGGSNLYTPGTIFFDEAPDQYGRITVRPVASEHPNVTQTGRSLAWYWRVTSADFDLGDAKVTHTYTYPQSAVVTGSGITEDEYVPARFSQSTFLWERVTAASVDESSNVITFSGPEYETTIAGEYTAGDDNPINPFGIVTVFFSYVNNGNWEDPNSWSLAGHTGTQVVPGSAPTSNAVVRVGDGHTINVTANNAVSGVLAIEGNSTLDVGTTTGHNFGSIIDEQITGNGTFRLSSSTGTAEFPAGDFSEFLGPTGGTVVYYRTGTNFTLPTVSAAPSSQTLNQYRNLVFDFTGAASGNNITFGANNITVLDDLVVRGVSGAFVQTATTTDGNITVNGDLKVESATFRVQHASANVRTITVNGDMYVESGAVFEGSGGTNVINQLRLRGNLFQNGTFNLWVAAGRYISLIYDGEENAFYTGTNVSASATIGAIEIDQGTGVNKIVTMNSLGSVTFQLSNNWLTLTNGIFRLARNSEITLSNTATEYIIPETAGLSVNYPSAIVNVGINNSNAADLILRGRLEILQGTVNVGNTGAFNQDIVYASAGTPELLIASGNLNVNGQIRRSLNNAAGSLIYRQTGGDVLIRGQNQNTERAKFEVLNTGSVFEMSGNSSIRILRGGSINFADFYVRPATANVTGGIVRFEPGSIGSQTFTLDTNIGLWDVTVEGVNGSNTATVNLQVNNLTVQNDLRIEDFATLGANDLNITVGGLFFKNTNNAIFTRNSQTVAFNGQNSQLDGDFVTHTFHNLAVREGASLEIDSGSLVRVMNNLTIELNATLDDGDVLIEVRNGVTSNGTHVSSANSDVFGITLNAATPQQISGRGVYGNLIINNTANVSLMDSIRVNNRLYLQSGLLDLGEHRLVLGSTSEVTGTFSSNRMLRSNGVLSDGGVRKEYPSTGSFTFPVGVFGKYTPATINVTNTSAPGTISVKAINAKHPSTRDAADLQLNFYWNVLASGFASIEASHTYQYRQSDVTGDESEYRLGRFLFPNWTPIGGIIGAVNTTSNLLTLVDVDYISGDYTAGEESEFVAVDTYYSRNGLSYPINWTDPNSWSADGHDGPVASTFPVGAPVIINTGHTVTTDGVDFLLAESVDLIGTAILDLEDTFGHNFGFVSGTGTIRIKATDSNQFIFPGGNYDDFVTPGIGGTVVFYDNIDGILPIQTQYNDVIMIGSSARTQANVNWIINGSLLVEDGTIENSLYNRNISIKGDWINDADDDMYEPGTGKVVLIGTQPQAIKGDYQTTFSFLELNGPGVKDLEQNATVASGMIFNRGNLRLNDFTLTWKPDATIGGTPADTSMIVINGDGKLRREIAIAGSLTFPVGDVLNTNDYSPSTITFNNGSFTSGAFVEMGVTNQADPVCGGGNYIVRYWTVEMSGISSFSGTGTFRYTNGDVVGNEAAIRTLSRGLLDTDCTVGDPTNTVTNTLGFTLSGTAFILTGGDQGAILPPGVQPSDINFIAITATTIELSWTNGDGTGRVVLVREASAVDDEPENNTFYTADPNFSGSPDEIGTGNFVAFAGSSNTVTLTGLDPKTRYHFSLFEYNDDGLFISYLLTSPLLADALTKARFELTFTGAKGWRMIAIPLEDTGYDDVFVDAATTGLFTQGFPNSSFPAKSPNLMWYDETYAGTDLQRWRQPGDISDLAVPGRGYMYYVFGDVTEDGDYNVDFPIDIVVEGYEPALTGTFDFGVTYTEEGDEGWNLLGNPYDDAIDWDGAGWNKENVSDAVYIWDPNAIGGAQFLIWSNQVGDTFNGEIAKGQAFWVKAIDEDPELTVTRDAVIASATFYGKEKPDTAEVVSANLLSQREPKPVIAFSVHKEGMSHNAYVAFGENARRGLDRSDAYYMQPLSDTYVSIFTEADGENLSINFQPRKFNAIMEIPIQISGFRNGRSLSGQYEIRMDYLENIPDTWAIELVDKSNNRRVFWKDAFDPVLYRTPDAPERGLYADNTGTSRDEEDLSRRTNRGDNRFQNDGDESTFLFDLNYEREVRVQVPRPGETIMRKGLSGTSQTRFVLRISPNGEFDDLPEQVTLWQNYPNPFNPTTNIRFGLPLEESVSIEVYDVLGRRVSTLASGIYPAGVHIVQFNASYYASGVYFVRLQAGKTIHTRKMLLLK